MFRSICSKDLRLINFNKQQQEFRKCQYFNRIYFTSFTCRSRERLRPKVIQRAHVNSFKDFLNINFLITFLMRMLYKNMHRCKYQMGNSINVYELPAILSLLLLFVWQFENSQVKSAALWRQSSNTGGKQLFRFKYSEEFFTTFFFFFYTFPNKHLKPGMQHKGCETM